jgi:hypothetical protein
VDGIIIETGDASMEPEYQNLIPSERGDIDFEIISGTRRIKCRVLREVLEITGGLATSSDDIALRKVFKRHRISIHFSAERKYLKENKPDINFIIVNKNDI